MMTIQQIKNKLQQSLSGLRKKYPIEKLALFGSVTREDFTSKSDIDIMVEFNKPVGWEFFDLADDLEKMLERKVDLVSGRAIKSHYWDYIKKDIVYV